MAETGIINQTIAEKDEEMAELKEQAAEQKLAKQTQAAAASRPGASKGKAAAGTGDSPRSNMSSPWATDVRIFFRQFLSLMRVPALHTTPQVPQKSSASQLECWVMLCV